ncbi:MAG: pre-peptidase C-terminal domain-containing protein [Anaerolineae bacterium]|jgi:LasA protease
MNRRTGGLLATIAIIALTIGHSTNVSSLSSPPTPQARIDLSQAPPILSDGQFVHGPNVGPFNVAEYLQANGSPLAEHASTIELWCGYASVNPRVLLTLIERQSGLVQQNPEGNIASPLGGPEPGLERQIEVMVTALATAFYDHLYSHGARSGQTTAPEARAVFELADGTTATVSANTTSGTYAVAAAMAPLMTADDWSRLLSPTESEGFVTTYRRLFPEDDPRDTTNQILAPTAPPADLLQFPFPLGATWWFNGVHNWNGGSYGRPYSSMDFGTNSLSCSYPPSDDWTVAAAGGTGYHPSGYPCWYRIDHGNGWMTSYYHLLNPVPNGSVQRNDPVGTISCEICAGGFATSPHVHFSLLYNGAYVELHGTQLSGWTIHEGDGGYSTGYIERDGVIKVPYDYVTNDGIPDTNCPTSGGVILYQQADYDCAGEGEGVGYVLRTTPGWENVPAAFQDQASSVRVPAGWSVRLYEAVDRTGATVCLNGDDPEFAGDTYAGGVVPLDDSVSSFTVFDVSDCWDAHCGDACEPNDDPASATPVNYDDVRAGWICPAGDQDLFTFTGQAGDRVVIGVDAASDGSTMDSTLQLLDSDGTTVLAQNDDERPDQSDSHLFYDLPHDGVFYARVRDADHPAAGGADFFYSLQVVADALTPTIEIVSPPGDGFVDPVLHRIEVEASDGQSGVAWVEFLWHDGNWANPDWTWLGIDEDGQDGWTFDWDTSAIAEQGSIGVYAWAYDWADHWAGAGAFDLTLDRTPPTVTVSTAPLYGDASFRDFWVNLEGGWDNLSGVANYDVQCRDGVSGTWTDWVTETTETALRYVGEDGHTYFLRARARDRAGNVSTYTDGSAEHTVTLCPVAADAYEADDTAGTARWILPDAAMEMHNFHTEGDVDWIRFYAAPNITYTLATTNTGGHADTVLTLYDAGATTVIASNDDYPGMWPASRIDWRPTAGGFYWAAVEHWDPWAFGCTTAYGLTLVGSSPTPPVSHAYLPMTLRSAPARR